jgi:hypothetical protein
MAATMRVLATFLACLVFFFALLWAYDHGQANCHATRGAAQGDTRVNGAC